MRRRFDNPVVGPELIDVQPGARMDRDVCLGYLSVRKVADARIVIGPGARVRSGSVISFITHSETVLTRLGSVSSRPAFQRRQR